MNPVHASVISGGTTPQYVAVTGWMPAMGIRQIKFILDIMSRTGGLEVSVAIQTATDDPDSPDGWIPKGGWQDTTGRTCSGRLDISADVDPKFFVRFGLGTKNTSGSALERGEVNAVISTAG